VSYAADPGTSFVQILGIDHDRQMTAEKETCGSNFILFLPLIGVSNNIIKLWSDFHTKEQKNIAVATTQPQDVWNQYQP